MKFLFYLAVIASLVYYSNDISFKGKTLRTWAFDFLSEKAGGESGEKEKDGGLLNSVSQLLNPGAGTSLNPEQVKQVERLLGDNLSPADRESLNKLMKTLSKPETPPAAPAK